MQSNPLYRSRQASKRSMQKKKVEEETERLAGEVASMREALEKVPTQMAANEPAVHRVL